MVTVLECGEPYVSNSGKDVITVKLSVAPSGKHIWYRPWSGTTKDGEERDNISEFLKAVNRVPKGEMNWKSVEGAKGKCKLKIGEYNGEPTNEVAFFYTPRDTKATLTADPIPIPRKPTSKGQSISADEFQKLREQQEKAGGADPDNIPY